MIPKGTKNFLARLNFTPGKCYDAQTPNHLKKRYETKKNIFDHLPLDTTSGLELAQHERHDDAQSRRSKVNR